MSTGASFTKAWLGHAIVMGLLLGLVTLFARGSTATASPHATDASKKSPPATQCGPDWQVVPSPNHEPGLDVLNGVAVASSNDVWAVGYYFSSGTPYNTLVEHWNGAVWSIVPSPNQGSGYNYLYGVATTSPSDVWAVGYYSVSGLPDQTLVEHWNGSAWSVVPSPNQGTLSNQLSSVAATSANDVWAVGSSVSATLVEHWNGTAWSIVSSPNPGSEDNYLYGVAVSSSNDVWAVGYYRDDSHYYPPQTLVEHWNGSAWSVVPSPNQVGENYLNGVAVSSSNDVWAVGYYSNDTIYQHQTLVEHWNGSVWNIIPSPNQGQHGNELNGVAVASSNSIWAVGTYSDNGGFCCYQLMEGWNGSAWSIVPLPSPEPQGGALDEVAAVSSTEVWAVGDSAGSVPGLTVQTLVERLNQCPGAATPTPRVTPTSTPSSTPTLVPPPCPGERFTDVCPNDYFYTATLALADDGILSGYNTSPPCLNDLWIPCFNPYNSSTRGQISKVVSLAAGFNEPVSGQRFEDVPPGSTFYTYTERMAERNIISGYLCGGPSEPCIPPDNRPYFRTNNNVTRGQLSKMVALAFGWNDPPTGRDFEDVLPGSTFYTYTAQLYTRNIINGYECGGPSEPCIPPDNLPYFRPNNNVTRGQTAKIVDLARSQPQPTSTPTSAPTSTPAETYTVTVTVTATETPTNPDCQGIPPSQDMQISPGDCEPAGTSFSFAGSGFQQGENVRILVTAPDGTLLGAPYFIQADNNGDAGPVPFNTDSGNPIGIWHMNFEGVTSQHEAIGYFMLLPPQGPRK